MQELWLQHNQIAGLSALRPLTTLPSLAALFLSPNPLCDDFKADYRVAVVSTLPSLQVSCMLMPNLPCYRIKIQAEPQLPCLHCCSLQSSHYASHARFSHARFRLVLEVAYSWEMLSVHADFKIGRAANGTIRQSKSAGSGWPVKDATINNTPVMRS